MIGAYDIREQTQVRRSRNGVPYAPLKELVQSSLDIYDMVSLCDIVDGANLSYAWGEACLDLSGTTDETRFMLKGKSEPWNEWSEAC